MLGFFFYGPMVFGGSVGLGFCALMKGESRGSHSCKGPLVGVWAHDLCLTMLDLDSYLRCLASLTSSSFFHF